MTIVIAAIGCYKSSHTETILCSGVLSIN